MSDKQTPGSITLLAVVMAFAALMGALLLRSWLATNLAETGEFQEHVPGMEWDRYHETRHEVERSLKFEFDPGELFWTYDGTPTDLPGHWPHFRGPNYDNSSPENIPLANAFPEGGPRKLWTIELEEGYAGPAVHKGRVYILDHMQEGANTGDVLRCFSFADGKELWRSGYRIEIKFNHGITRTTPAVTEKYAVAIGPMGQVMCVHPETGKPYAWGLDMMKAYGTRNLSKMWYAGQCPIIDGNKTIIAPVGTNTLMIAVHCETGEVLWEVPQPAKWRISHASITPMTAGGTRQYVYAADGGVIGVGAEGDQEGQTLWTYEKWPCSVVMPSPVVLSGDRIFLTSGYKGGCVVFQITGSDGGFSVKEIYNFSGPKLYNRCFSTYQQTPIYFEKHLFGIQLNAAKEYKREFVCVDPNEPGGRFVWTSGPETTFFGENSKREAWSPYLLADGKFYVMSDTGDLVVFEATSKEMKKLGRWTIFDHGHEVWGPMAITGGRMLVRDLNRMHCFDIRAEAY